MAQAVKDIFDRRFLVSLSDHLASHAEQFDQAGFLAAFAEPQWSGLELKQRINFIIEQLHVFIAGDYRQRLVTLNSVAALMPNYKHVVFPGYVAAYGLDDFDASVEALGWMTRFSTAEFAVRPFIEKYPQKMMQQMMRWTTSDNHHLRRLASEGCRPRLPWASYLNDFIQDPSAIIPILEALRFDSSDYVRKSVANNLNDISKDHPQRVLDLMAQWLNHDRQPKSLVSHAMRTLLRRGDRQALALIGFNAVSHVQLENFTANDSLKPADDLQFAFDLTTDLSRLGNLRLEFAIVFARLHGKQSRRVFKISQANYRQQRLSVSKIFSFRPVSTRSYYPGEHRLEIIVNGEVKAGQSFIRD